MTRPDLDHDLAALVDAHDSAAQPVGPPDLMALRAAGRRRLAVRRAATVVAAAVVVAVVALGTSLVTGDDAARPDDPVATQPTASTPPPVTETSDSEPPPSRAPDRLEQGELTTPQGRVGGEWEAAPPLGEVLVVGRSGAYDEVFYAIASDGPTMLARGLRDGDRILRTSVVFGTVDAEGTDAILLYGGDVLGLPGDPVDTTGGRYLVLGLVSGDVDVTVTPQGGARRPVTGRSAALAPGFTAFYDSGAWQDGWDPVQLAPLRVQTSAGASAFVRTDSFVY